MDRIKQDVIPYEIIARVLSVNYESVYDINVKTSAYKIYHESDSYSEFRLKNVGDNFFEALKKTIPGIICPEDREYVMLMLSREELIRGVQNDRHYSFFYRIQRDHVKVFHQIRAVMQKIDGEDHILLGVCNVDAMVNRETMHREALESMHQKEKNHLEAILGSAAGYLEANLTKNKVIEMSFSPAYYNGPNYVFETPEEVMSYNDFETWFCKRYVGFDSEKYSLISSRDYLISCFERGEKRVAVSFYLRSRSGEHHPFKKAFYLYRDNASGDIFAFAVIHDLTEQQKREMELEKLEDELRMSRIRNFSSQMQPHFLYNALGSIQEIVLEDPAYASELIGDFSVHLRSCVRAMSSDQLIPFSREFENIMAYVNIEKMRFGVKLKVRYDIAARDFMILPLSIQPLVENAIRHGIYQRGGAGGTVTISSREEKDCFIVEVQDDGVGFDVPAYQEAVSSGKKDSTGLCNIIFRFDKVMHADVNIKSTVGKGTKVTVRIPKGGIPDESDNS